MPEGELPKLAPEISTQVPFVLTDVMEGSEELVSFGELLSNEKLLCAIWLLTVRVTVLLDPVPAARLHWITL